MCFNKPFFLKKKFFFFETSKNLVPGIYTEQLNTTGFPAGTYIARLTLNNKTYHKKLVKTEDTH